MSRSSEPVDVTRRRLLAAAGASMAWLPGVSGAATAIENSPASGGGWMNTEGRRPDELVVSSPAEVTPAAAASAQPSDWRQLLLMGERSILVRRGGKPVRIRYTLPDGTVDRAGYAQACFMLRDVRAGKVIAMDPRLLDVLCGIQRWMEHNGRSSVIDLLSGFRTDATNRSTEGAARNSLHLQGRAADIHIDGASSALVGAMVKVFNNGGTGVYLNRGFVHVDTGAKRTWVSTVRR